MKRHEVCCVSLLCLFGCATSLDEIEKVRGNRFSHFHSRAYLASSMVSLAMYMYQ